MNPNGKNLFVTVSEAVKRNARRKLINERNARWAKVTTEDLRATIRNYPKTEAAKLAYAEWVRRMGNGNV